MRRHWKQKIRYILSLCLLGIGVLVFMGCNICIGSVKISLGISENV